MMYRSAALFFHCRKRHHFVEIGREQDVYPTITRLIRQAAQRLPDYSK